MVPVKVGRKLSLVIFLLVGLSGVAVFMNNQLACEGQLVNHNFAPTADQQIWGERIVSQSFVAPHHHLNRIDIFFQTYRRRNISDVTLRLLEVSPGSDNPLQGTELFSISFNASELSNESWRTFIFPPIPDSAGKTYLISLQSPHSRDGNAITVGGVQQDLYPAGNAFLGPSPVEADITFRTCYQVTFTHKIKLLFEQLTRARPAIWNQTTFYLLAGISYLIIVSFFFWKLMQLIL